LPGLGEHEVAFLVLRARLLLAERTGFLLAVGEEPF